MAATLASVSLMGFIGMLLIRERTTQLVENELRTYTRLLATKKLGSELDSAIDAVTAFANATGCRITIISGNGTVLADSQQRLPLDSHLDRPEIIEARLRGTGTAIRHSATTGKRELYAAVSQSNAGKVDYYVRAARPFVELENTVGNLVKALLAVSIITLLPCLLLSLVLFRKIVEPVRRLERHTAMIVNGEDPGSVLLPDYDELGELTKNINAIFAQQRELFANFREEKRKLSAIFAGIAEGVMLLDARLHIEEINESMLRMLAKTRQETIGKTPLEVLRSSDLKSAIDSLLANAVSQRIEIKIDEAKQVFWEIDIAVAADKMDPKIVIVARDISKLKRLEYRRSELPAGPPTEFPPEAGAS